MAEGRYLLGVDIGTYSSKGVLTDRAGAVVGSHAVDHGLSSPRAGWFEHDADDVWWRDFTTIVRMLLESGGIEADSIAGIGTSAIGSCVLPVDEAGRPLRPAILYGIDTRAREETDYLSRLSGRRLTSQDSGPKVLWIRRHEPEVYERTRWFLTSQAYLVHRLTGRPSIDVYTAGGYRPAYDAEGRRWVDGMARHVAPVERFPPAYWSHEVVGQVSAEAARETGLAPGTPVVAGTTDAAAEALSAGMSRPGDMMVMLGSSIFFILRTEALAHTERFWTSNFLTQGTYAFMGGMSTAGSLTTWFREQFGETERNEEASGGRNAYAALADIAAASPPGANGLVALPYFEGERTPLHDPDAKGVFFGLRLRHTRGDIYRALLESVAYGIRHNIEAMEEEGERAQRILAVGGGTANELWLQMVSDIAGVEMEVPERTIGASYGDAFLAGVGTGLVSGMDEIGRWVRVKQTIRPVAARRAVYDRGYSVFLGLYEGTKRLMRESGDAETDGSG